MSTLLEAGTPPWTPPSAPDNPSEQRKALPSLPTWNSSGHLANVDDRDALYRAMGEE